MNGNGTSIAQLYLSVCEERGIELDQDVVDALVDGSETVILKGEAHVIVLLHLFMTLPELESRYPTKLVISAARLSASTMGTLGTYLTHQRHLTHLAIKDTQLPEMSVEIVLNALTASAAAVSPLMSASFTNVGLKAKDAQSISVLLTQPLGGLSYLDLSNNMFNFPGVRTLTTAVTERNKLYDTPLELNLSGNLVTIEILNSITHGVGAIIALIAGSMLTFSAKRNGLKDIEVASIGIYCASLFSLLASSCAYHTVFRYPRLHRLFRRADHFSIFLLIAGTYTPFIVAYALNTVIGRATLAAVWTFAFIGIVRSILGIGTNRTRAFFALVTGWIGLMAQRTMVTSMQPDALKGVVAGGITYSVGIIFYLLGKRFPMMHVIWHFAVMIAGGFHYLTLSRYVVHGR